MSTTVSTSVPSLSLSLTTVSILPSFSFQARCLALTSILRSVLLFGRANAHLDAAYRTAIELGVVFAIVVLCISPVQAADNGHQYVPIEVTEELSRLVEDGRKLLQNEKSKEAELVFEKAVALAPHSYRAHYGLGRSMLEQGRYFKAEQNFLTCTLLTPRENLARFGMAEVYEHTGRFADAVLVYE